MNLGELRDVVRGNVDRQEDAFSDDLIDTHINMAVRVVEQTHTFNEMRKLYSGTLTSGTFRYNKPDNCKSVLSVRVLGNSGGKLERRGYRVVDEESYDPETFGVTGVPTQYFEYGEMFELRPVPDDAYTVHMRCSVYSGEKEGDTAEFLLVGKDQLILSRATATCLESIGEVELAAYWHNRSLEDFNSAVSGDPSEVDNDFVLEGWPPPESKNRGDHRSPWR